MVVVTETPLPSRPAWCVDARPELAGAVGVEQVRLEHALADQHRPPGRQPLAVERARPERRRDQRVVHDRDGRRRDLRAEPVEQERGTAIEARAAGRAGDRAHEARRGLRVEHDGHLDRLHLPGAQPPQRPRRRLAPDRFRVLQLGPLARARVPVVALHLAVQRRDRRHADAEARRRVAVSEAVRRRIGVAGAAVGILGALRVGHARIALERRRLGPARDLDLLLWRQVGAGILEVEVGDPRDQGRRVRQPGVRILRGDLRQRRRLVDDSLERIARQIGGRRGGRGAAREHAQGQALLARVVDVLDLPHPHGDAEVALLDEEAVGGGGPALSGALEHGDQQVSVHCSGVLEAGFDRGWPEIDASRRRGGGLPRVAAGEPGLPPAGPAVAPRVA